MPAPRRSNPPRSYIVQAEGANLRTTPHMGADVVKRLAGGDRIVGVLARDGQDVGGNKEWVWATNGYVWTGLLQIVRMREGTPQHDPVDPPGPKRT